MFKQNVILLVYDELPDDTLFEMRQHAERCLACNRELESAQQFRADVSATPVLEPTPNLLASSRLRLQEALETAEQHRGWRAWIFDPVDWLRQIRFSPALAAAILIVGFAGGVMTAFRMQPVSGGGTTPGQSTEASIAGIRGITQDPNTNTVQINYEKLLPASARGSIDNPDIEKLLLYAAHTQENPGVRVESVSILSQKCHDAEVRQAMMRALLEDRNPGVRLQALDGLDQYVKEDIQVRDTVIQALLHDTNQGVRTEAIRLLQPVKADSAVRSAFEQLAREDENEYIRSESERTLASLPDID
ncbi:MAG TPA: HEAT repeat domain-containing protein [Candidatus Angelobacter sp.]|nr:HEAT repeat domain-containing protein [Candidatus Angelobacter sp.]